MRLLARGVCNPALGRFSAFGPKPINTAVERQEASVPIARRANAFARCSGGSIARPAKGASHAPSASRRSIPSWGNGKRDTGGPGTATPRAAELGCSPSFRGARQREPGIQLLTGSIFCVSGFRITALRAVIRNDNQEATAGFRLRASRGWSLLRGRARARDGAAIRR